MPLELIGVGFGRTGTESTKVALDRLGYRCYHMSEVVNGRRNPGHLDFWLDVSETGTEAVSDWERVFADYRATVDFPAACAWRELLQAYPEAKVLLTLHPRGPQAWYESTWQTIHRPQRMWQAKLMAALIPFFRKMTVMPRKLIWDGFLGGSLEDREQAVKRYLDHIEQVKAVVPEERLLVFQADQGWQPLCDFLGEPVPEGPFPYVNDRKAMLRRIHGVVVLAYGVLAGAAVGIAALVYGAIRLFS